MKLYASRNDNRSWDKYVGKDLWVSVCDVDDDRSYKGYYCTVVGTVYYVRFISRNDDGTYKTRALYVDLKDRWDWPNPSDYYYGYTNPEAARIGLDRLATLDISNTEYIVGPEVLTTDELVEAITTLSSLP